MLHTFLWATSFLAMLACGSEKNAGDDARDLTPEEQAKELMNQGSYSSAIAILSPLVKAEPKDYARRPLLSAAYAASVGISLLDIVQSELSKPPSSGTSIFSQISNFLPKNYKMVDVVTMATSIAILAYIPKTLRGVNGDPDYGPSADFQLTLYRGLYATMYLYLFFPGGKLDINALESMSLQDAENILGALGDAASDGSTPESKALGKAIGGTLSGINNESGDNDQEKIVNYMSK